MATFKCKMCGGELDVREGVSVLECDYCGTKQTLPLFTENSERLLYESGNNYLNHSEYDKAENVFNQLLTIKPDAAELYWDLVLCKYGVTYVKDPKTDKYIPTCNRTHFESVFLDENYKKAIVLATEEKKAYFEEVANTLDTIQKGILAIFKKEKPFDVFISYKETDADGKRTKDSLEAQKLYEKLTEAGYKVFFSRITLEKKAGTEYEPYIYAALYSSKVMLTVSSCRENLESPWVKNEWSRFLSLRQKDNAKTLIPLYFDMEKEALPSEFSLLPAQDMKAEDFQQELLRGIKKIIPTPITKAEKRKKLFISLGSVFAACAAVTALLLFVIFPKLEADRAREAEARRLLNAYTEAVVLFDEGEYEKALSSFRVLGDYKDSKEKVTVLEKELIPYAKAQKLFEEGNLEEAAVAFDALGDYKDSKAMAQEIWEKGIPYGEAKKLYNEGKYPEAAWAFKAIGDYRDSAEMQKKAELSWRKSLASVVACELDAAYHAIPDGSYFVAANGTLSATEGTSGGAHTRFDASSVAAHGKIVSVYRYEYFDSPDGSGTSNGNTLIALYEDGTFSNGKEGIWIKPCLTVDGTVPDLGWEKIVYYEHGVIYYGVLPNVTDQEAMWHGVAFRLGVTSDGTLLMDGTAKTFYQKALNEFSNVRKAKIDFETGVLTVLTKDKKVLSFDPVTGKIKEYSIDGACDLVSAGLVLKRNGDVVEIEEGTVVASDCVYGEEVICSVHYESPRSIRYFVTKNGTVETGKTKVHDEWILKMQ